MPFARLADRLVLMPSRHAIHVHEKTHRRIPFGPGHLDAWIQSSGPSHKHETALFILKFNGNASRAELAGLQPADMWPDLQCQVWAINPPGYGNSSGRASLQVLPDVALAAYEAIAQEARGRPILISGNSLGTAMALQLASQREVAGLLLRNPVPLRELIYERFGWWNLYLGSALIARQVPAQLDAIANAAQCHLPALFLQSSADTLVPPSYQQRIIEPYAGEKQVVTLEGAEHDTPLSESMIEAYRPQANWLREAIGLGGTRE